MNNRYIVYNDNGPDSLGRRSFTMYWIDPNGIFRLGASKDGYPVGFHRAQCFRCRPERHIQTATVLSTEAEAQAALLRVSGNGPCFCDSDGVLRYIRDIPAENLIFEQRPVYDETGRLANEWIEIMLLADADGEAGRDVIDSYVLYTTEERLRAALRADDAEDDLRTA